MQTAIEMKLTWILDSVNKLGVIGNVQVINTDSDQALKIAVAHVFPHANHIFTFGIF